MTFLEYMRWDGFVALASGAALLAMGLAEGAQGPVDAVSSGIMMLIGTSVFVVVRHRVPFRSPGAWFTATPLAGAGDGRAPSSRGHVMLRLLGETMLLGAVAVGLSKLTNSWLTYMDCGVWAMAIGVIKIGPAATAIARHEASTGTSYRVARRRVRGLVELTAEAAPPAGRGAASRRPGAGRSAGDGGVERVAVAGGGCAAVAVAGGDDEDAGVAAVCGVGSGGGAVDEVEEAG
jgi:hypothetical protein